MGRTIFVIALVILLLGAFNFAVSNVHAPEETTIRLVDAKTGLNSTSLGSPDDPMPPEGYSFTVNVTLDGAIADLITYQIGIKFNSTKIRCTAAWITKTDPNYVFYGKTSVVSPVKIGQIDNVTGYFITGATLLTSSIAVSRGLFCQANFTAIKTGTFSLDLVPPTDVSTDPYYGKDTFLWDSNLFYVDYIAKSFSVSVAAASSSPIADFTFSPSNPEANGTVTFNASSSFDPDGSIVSYKWDFGDDNVSTVAGATINHTYISNNAYHVTLTVFDNDGFNSSITKVIMVGGIPSPDFTYDPLNPYREDVVTFNASQSFDVDGSISLYVWDFGDGANQTTPESVVTHVFVQNGLFNVKLTVFDNDGLYSSTTKQVFVGKAPIAEFTFSPENPWPDEEIIFDASLSYDLDGQIIHAIWDFCDINVTEVDVASPADLVIAHAYLVQGGIYAVNLTVFDDDGLYASTIHDVNVTIVYPEYPHYRCIVFNVVWERIVYKVLLSGNSTVAHFNFNQSLAQLRFEVSGETDTAGYCNITIPKTLLKGNPWNVMVNGEPWTYSLLENSSHYFVYFNYTLASTLQVTIQGTWVVPEFQPTVTLPLFVLLTILFLAIKKKKMKRLQARICHD